MRKICFILMMILSFPLAAENIKSIITRLSPAKLSELEKEKKLIRFSEDKKSRLVFCPNTLSGKRISLRHQDENPDLTVEVLRLLELPGNEDILSIYNKVHRIRKLSGVRYYSSKNKRYGVLFENVYRIQDLKTKKEMPDKVFKTIPLKTGFPFHVWDDTLKDCFYQAEYYYNPDNDAIHFSMNNLEAIRYYVKAVDEKALYIDVIIIPLDNALLFYGYCGVDINFKGLAGNFVNFSSLFYRRMDAVYVWFYNTIYEADIWPEAYQPPGE